MDSLSDYFFWTWKIGPSAAGIVEAPLWSYQNGLRNNYMPADPRTALGKCGTPAGPIFDQTFQPWQTGGPGADIRGAAVQYPYPPATLASAPGPASLLPTYTTTGTIHTLPMPTYTDSRGSTINAGNGWFNAADTAPAPTPISGCTYPDQWDALNAAIPACAAAVRRAAAPSRITPTPVAMYR